MDRVMILGIGASLTGLLIVLELVRRRKLREDYSLLWLATAIVLLALSLSRPLLDGLANLLGVITYPPAAFFAVAIGFMLMLLLQYSMVLTRLARENKQMAQQMAILRWELAETRRALHADQPAPDRDPHQQHGDVHPDRE